jgi:hypothetical protein
VVSTFHDQHGLCANRACGRELILEGIGKDRAMIDHCHNTGKFRALLCMQCNLMVGYVDKQKNILLGLIEYASKHLINNQTASRE